MKVNLKKLYHPDVCSTIFCEGLGPSLSDRIAKNSFLEMNEVDCRSLLSKVASHIICIHSYV